MWSEIWDDISPLIERALAGEATFNEDLHLVMERNGYPEDTWYCGVGVKGARRILAEHIIGGEPVEDLRYIAPPGDNKLKD